MTRSDIDTVTFLFTDIVGSTRLWAEHREAMGAAIARHDALLRAAVEQHGGRVFKTVGDAVCAAFADPLGAITAAIAGQRALASESWTDVPPPRARMAIHTGVAEARGGDWFGQPVNRVARLLAVGHGGQVLVSLATEELVADHLPDGVHLRDLGEHRLKDLARPEHVFQVLAPDLAEDFPALRSVDSHPNNLPSRLTSFVGREPELAAIRDLLRHHRLVTLTGVGGTGKTRLALQVAAEVLDQFPDGVWFVDLAPVLAPDVIAETMAAALKLCQQRGRTIADTVKDHLASRRTLIVMDNCEHLVTACAALSEDLLQAAPGLHILATSREPLAAAGEQVEPVQPLGLPGERALDPEAVIRFDAVRLFVDRAVASRPDFVVTSANAPAVAQICQRLDGIPLAIELAAARSPVLSADQIAARLGERFRLLTSGLRTALPRQRTLRATIDWSHDLLTGPERTLFRRLAVFRGGWKLEAAEAICAGADLPGWEVLDVLAGLVAKSLVGVRHEALLPYYLLETLRDYAAERLAASGEADAVAGRHARWYADLAAAAETDLGKPQSVALLAQVAAEQENVAAALDWASVHEPATGLRLVGTLWRGWYLCGRFAEGRRLIEAQLAVAGPTADPMDMAQALHGLGTLIALQRDLVAGRRVLERALELWRTLDQPLRQARTLNNLAWAAYEQGDYAGACKLFEESLAGKRAEGDTRGVATTLGNLGLVYTEMGDLRTARALYEEALTLARRLDDPDLIAFVLFDLGQAAIYRGDYESATALVCETLDLRGLKGDREAVVEAQRFLGQIAHESGDRAAARTHYVAALAGEQRLLVDRAHDLGPENATVLLQFGIAEALRCQARLDLDEGQTEAARAGFEESLPIHTAIGNRGGRCRCLAGLARVALIEGDPASAASRLGQALAILDGLPAWNLVLDLLPAIALLAAASRRPAEALRLLAAIDAARGRAGIAPPACLRVEAAAIQATARAALTPAAAETAYIEGAALGLPDAFRLARDVVVKKEAAEPQLTQIAQMGQVRSLQRPLT